MGNELTEAVGTVTTQLAESINLGTVAGIVAAVIGAGIGLYLGWFAIRKVVSAVKKALHGRLSV